MNEAQRRVIVRTMATIDRSTREGQKLHEEYALWLEALDEEERRAPAEPVPTQVDP